MSVEERRQNIRGKQVMNEMYEDKQAFLNINAEDMFQVISGKEFKASKLALILVSVLFFLPSAILMVVLNAKFELVWMNMLWLFALSAEVAVIVIFIWMMFQRQRFLSSPDVEKYAKQLHEGIWRITPTEVITKGYVFKKLQPSSPIDLSQVEWLYRKRFSTGNQHSDNIVFRMKNGKKREMNYRVSLTESDMYHLIQPLNPRVMIGNTMNNKKEYDRILKEGL